MKKPLLNEENIILIGMPGAGKSTCGVLAAKILLKNFFDTDLLIQSMENKRLQQIINEKGTAEFKRAEEAAVLSLDIKGTVIATGGSVVYSPKAMAHLKSMGKVIYMHLSYDEMKSVLKIFLPAESFWKTGKRCWICITSAGRFMKNTRIIS